MVAFPMVAKQSARIATDAPKILAADDQPHILDAVELLLEPEGYRVARAQSPREVRERIASETLSISVGGILLPGNAERTVTSAPFPPQSCEIAVLHGTLNWVEFGSKMVPSGIMFPNGSRYAWPLICKLTLMTLLIV